MNNINENRKVVLLQTLGVSAEDITALQAGRAELSAVLKERINEITSDPTDMTQSAIVCQNIRLDKMTYETLDPEPYLEHIKELKGRGGVFNDTFPARHRKQEASQRIFNDTPTDGADRTASYPFGGPRPEDRNLQNNSVSGTPSGSPSQPPTGNQPGGYGQPHNYNQPGGYGQPYNYNQPGGYGQPYNYNQPVNNAQTARTAVKEGPSSYPHPLNRFMARMVDMSICTFLCSLFFRLVLGSDPISDTLSGGWLSTVWMISVYLLMFLVEPLIIHFFKTTPGKLIFGLRLTAADGSALPLKALYKRSLLLFWFGFGFSLPIYNIYRMIRSLISCRRRETLPWDTEVTISRPQRNRAWRVIICVVAFVTVILVDTLTMLKLNMPRNTGLLTETEFYENCAYIVKYNSISFDEQPDYKLTIENGYVTAVTYTCSISDENYIYDKYYETYVPFMALAAASDSANFLSANAGPYLTTLSGGFGSYEISYAGYLIQNEVEYTGYNRNLLYGYLYKSSADEEHTYSQTFTISIK